MCIRQNKYVLFVKLVKRGHYKREHCWGHMILEVAGFAHMPSVSLNVRLVE